MYRNSQIVHRYTIHNSVIKRKYKVFPIKYTLEDYFKGSVAEKFSSDTLIKNTLMSENSKSDWIASLARQEDGYKKNNNNYYGFKKKIE